MARSKAHANIHSALKKLRDEANEKEIELLDLIATVYEQVQDKKDEAVQKVQDSATAVNTSVHLHPWGYIGGAAAIGVLVGWCLRK